MLELSVEQADDGNGREILTVSYGSTIIWSDVMHSGQAAGFLVCQAVEDHAQKMQEQITGLRHAYLQWLQGQVAADDAEPELRRV